MLVLRLALTVLLVGAGCLAVSGPASAKRLPGSAHGGHVLTTDLSPQEEVPPTASVGTGFATLTLNPGREEVCFDITVDNLTSPVFAGHIHQAPAGQNGPIVVSLFMGAPTTGERFTGCVSGARALLEAIIDDPTGFYVNVHTVVFPNGEIRGQLGD